MRRVRGGLIPSRPRRPVLRAALLAGCLAVGVSGCGPDAMSPEGVIQITVIALANDDGQMMMRFAATRDALAAREQKAGLLSGRAFVGGSVRAAQEKELRDAFAAARSALTARGDVRTLRFRSAGTPHPGSLPRPGGGEPIPVEIYEPELLLDGRPTRDLAFAVVPWGSRFCIAGLEVVPAHFQ